MPAQSHGMRIGALSKSTPNLAALRALSSGDDETDSERATSPETHALKEPLIPSIERQTSSGSRKIDDVDGQGTEDASLAKFDHDIRNSLSSPSSSEFDDDEDNDAEAGAQLEGDDEDSRARPPGIRPLTRISTDPTAQLPSPGGLLSPPPSSSSFGRPAPKRPLYTSRSHSYLGPTSFAPPFYNRPPTPLPPSPSLTSLLRPPFSAQPSRPTTPDSSDTEATNLTAATSVLTSSATGTTSIVAGAVARSALAATTVPRASPKIPTYEYYGFVLYLGSSAAFLMYLLWSYLPQPFLHQLGIYYYPNRWWSLAIPSWLVVCLIYIYVALAAYNTGYLTLPMSDLGCLVDEAADVAVVDAKGRIVKKRHRKPPYAKTDLMGLKQAIRTNSGLTTGDSGRSLLEGGSGGGRNIGSTHHNPHRAKQKHATASGQRYIHPYTHDHNSMLEWKRVWRGGTDAVMDVPVGGVCEVLYGGSQSSESDEETEERQIPLQEEEEEIDAAKT